MIDLTNVEELKKLDPKDVYGSTGMLSAQCEQIWEDAKIISFPQDYKNVKNIVICGMGGSAYGGHVVKVLFKEELKLPLTINNDYTLPGFVNSDTLVIITSYSGTTEESLNNARLAKEKDAKVVILTSGGSLADFSKQNNFPGFIFQTPNNPSNQPRLGTGYILLGTISILSKLGFITVDDETVSSAVANLKGQTETIKTKAIETAKSLEGFMPVIFAAEFLEGNAHIMRNQFNETSKSFSTFSDIPELNHHLMEGLKNPTDKKLKIIFLESGHYSDIIKKRISLTHDVVSKNNIEYSVFEPTGSTKLAQVLEALSFGSFLTVYLAFVYGLDPSLIPWVDYFKQALKSL